MGLKTDKATKTSRLSCQYVGSFSVKDEDKKLTMVEQNRFVDAKLKNSKKNLLEGIPVCLQVSPDGIQVLASDEKTIKMAHTLRRVSYATAEPTTKLFAYVSHQPRSDKEVVCHTFLTKKKEHAEALSAALGKLFKQAFAYTLKRRDKLEEAVQKRGGNRRWAKHQAAEGHDAMVKNTRNIRGRSFDLDERGNGAIPKPARVSPQVHPDSLSSASTDADVRGLPRQNPQVHPNPQIAAFRDADTRGRRPPPGPPAPGFTSHELDNQFTTATAHPPPKPKRQLPQVSSSTAAPEWESSFTAPRFNQPHSGVSALNSHHAHSPAVTPSAPPSWLMRNDVQPPVLPSRPRSSSSSVPHSSLLADPADDRPPELPQRRRRTPTSPTSPTTETASVMAMRDPFDSSETSASWECSNAIPTTAQNHFPQHRKFSAPPDLMPSSVVRLPKKTRRSSDSSAELSSSRVPISQGHFDAANAWLKGSNGIPPPLPRKQWHSEDSLPHEQATIPEEIIGPEEDKRLRRAVSDEPRVSLTLEDEDWYMPNVSRKIVTEMLETSDIGTFFVRDSQSCPGWYALTMKVLTSDNNPTGFNNYLIKPEGDGFSLQSFDKVFPDISTLIRHYASVDDGLPCRLILAGSNPLFHDANGYLVEFLDEEDDKYTSLSDCSSMFQELNMNNTW